MITDDDPMRSLKCSVNDLKYWISISRDTNMSKQKTKTTKKLQIIITFTVENRNMISGKPCVGFYAH